MRRYIGLAIVGCLFAIGCDQKSTSGGPGVTKSEGRESGIHVRQPEDTFKLETPTLETSVKQGESKGPVKIGISRGKNFDQDVKLSFSEPPKGVKITPASPVLKAGDKEASVTLEAAPDAALGRHTITVTGTPEKGGAPATTELKIDVKKAG
jgi:hypothetical protein